MNQSALQFLLQILLRQTINYRYKYHSQLTISNNASDLLWPSGFFSFFFFACYAFSLQVFENSFWAFSVNSSPACSHALEIQPQSKSSNIYHKTLFAVVCTSIVFNILHMLHYYFKHTTRIIISTQPSEQMSCGNVILEWISWGTTSLMQVKT